MACSALFSECLWAFMLSRAILLRFDWFCRLTSTDTELDLCFTAYRSKMPHCHLSFCFSVRVCEAAAVFRIACWCFRWKWIHTFTLRCRPRPQQVSSCRHPHPLSSSCRSCVMTCHTHSCSCFLVLGTSSQSLKVYPNINHRIPTTFTPPSFTLTHRNVKWAKKKIKPVASTQSLIFTLPVISDQNFKTQR